MLKGSSFVLSTKAGNWGNILLTSRNPQKYFYQCTCRGKHFLVLQAVLKCIQYSVKNVGLYSFSKSKDKQIFWGKVSLSSVQEFWVKKIVNFSEKVIILTWDKSRALFYDLTRNSIANNFVTDVYCRFYAKLLFSIRSKAISYVCY